MADFDSDLQYLEKSRAFQQKLGRIFNEVDITEKQLGIIFEKFADKGVNVLEILQKNNFSEIYGRSFVRMGALGHFALEVNLQNKKGSKEIVGYVFTINQEWQGITTLDDAVIAIVFAFLDSNNEIPFLGLKEGSTNWQLDGIIESALQLKLIEE